MSVSRAMPASSARSPRSPRAPAAPRSSCALAIGGLDPGGGAGIAADLRAFSAAGAFGCAAVAVLTVQSTAGLKHVRDVPAREVVAAATEVLRNQRVRAVKVGALGSRENVRAVAKLLAAHPGVPVIIDTPIAPTRGPEVRPQAGRHPEGAESEVRPQAGRHPEGAESEVRPQAGRHPEGAGNPRLLAVGALAALRDSLLPTATLVTANLDEVHALLGERVRTVGEAHDAARALATLSAGAALVKGGHMQGTYAIDVLAVEGEVIELRARRLSIAPTHGTGCTFASLIAGRLAVRGPAHVDRDTLVSAVRWAKRVHHAALARALDVGKGLRVLVF
jgi:hydroxymethylpyrimidine/phosphomethylpyrimidine kinase